MCNESKNVGEEIARLDLAKGLLASVTSVSSSNSNLCDLKEWKKQAEKSLEMANRDNDMIYHEQVTLHVPVPIRLNCTTCNPQEYCHSTL